MKYADTDDDRSTVLFPRCLKYIRKASDECDSQEKIIEIIRQSIDFKMAFFEVLKFILEKLQGT